MKSGSKKPGLLYALVLSSFFIGFVSFIKGGGVVSSISIVLLTLGMGYSILTKNYILIIIAVILTIILPKAGGFFREVLWWIRSHGGW